MKTPLSRVSLLTSSLALVLRVSGVKSQYIVTNFTVWKYNSVPNFIRFLQRFAKFDNPTLSDLASNHLCTVIQTRILYLTLIESCAERLSIKLFFIAEENVSCFQTCASFSNILHRTVQTLIKIFEDTISKYSEVHRICTILQSYVFRILNS
jgi:hypothetical protein